MIWVLIIVVTIFVAFIGTKKKSDDVVKKCEVIFYCMNPKCEEHHRTITVRHYSMKRIQCKWCGTHYTFYANGTRFQKIEAFLTSVIIPVLVPQEKIISIGVDETVLEGNKEYSPEFEIGDEVYVRGKLQPRSFIGHIVSFTEQESAFVEEPMTRRRFEIPLDDLEHAVNV